MEANYSPEISVAMNVMNLVLVLLTTLIVKSETNSSKNLFFNEGDEVESSYLLSGEAESLMWVDKINHSIMVDYEKITNIFSNNDLADRKIVTVSIIGALRKGKSFFLNYCLRYLYANVSRDSC